MANEKRLSAEIAEARIRSVLSPQSSVLSSAARLAAEHGWHIYLVGGWVRDAILGIANDDIDVSVVGDAQALAHLLAQELGAQVETHNRFDTATITFPDQSNATSPGARWHLDLVTARSETYERSGALPTVRAGTIEDDLARRDFTVNAMAASLGSEGPGRLVDPHGGLDDLNSGLIRVLHDRSFIDDPTRLFRAVRFAMRLGFRIEEHTLELALRAVRDGALYTVSTDRAVREFLKVLEEPRAGAMLTQLEKLGLLQGIHPELHWPYESARLGITEDDTTTRQERRDAYLGAIGAEFAREPEEATRLARALSLTAPHVKLMHDSARLAQLWPRLGKPEMSRSQVYNLLETLDINALEAYGRISALSADKLAWDRLHEYLNVTRHITPEVTGDYLRLLGVPPGPAYKRILGALRNARLDDLLTGKEEEERFVDAMLREEDLLDNGT